MFRDISNNDIYVDNVAHGRWDPYPVKNQLAFNADLDKKMVTDRLVRFIQTHVEQEPGASGKSVIDDYLRGPLAGHSAYGDRPTGSKEDRARPWASCVAAGRAFLVIGEGEGSARWIDSYVQEHRRFPGGEYKDQVDASSGAFNMLHKIGSRPQVA